LKKNNFILFYLILFNKMGTKIERWDMVEERNIYIPMLYFKPTLDQIDLIKLNKGQLYINITGTGSYDGLHRGIIDLSRNIPNCRPDFFDQTQLYVLILPDTSFTQYPNKNQMGSFKISSNIYPPPKKDPKKDPKKAPKKAPKKDPKKDPKKPHPAFLSTHPHPNKNKGLNGLEIGLIVTVIVLLLLLAFGGGWILYK